MNKVTIRYKEPCIILSWNITGDRVDLFKINNKPGLEAIAWDLDNDGTYVLFGNYDGSLYFVQSKGVMVPCHAIEINFRED